MDTKKYLQEWAQKYKNDLVNDIMPFWMEHGLDRQAAALLVPTRHFSA